MEVKAQVAVGVNHLDRLAAVEPRGRGGDPLVVIGWEPAFGGARRPRLGGGAEDNYFGFGQLTAMWVCEQKEERISRSR